MCIRDRIDATAISKGKGFQGAIKRHGQHRGPMAHGSKFHRHQGCLLYTSIDQKAYGNLDGAAIVDFVEQELGK